MLSRMGKRKKNRRKQTRPTLIRINGDMLDVWQFLIDFGIFALVAISLVLQIVDMVGKS